MTDEDRYKRFNPGYAATAPVSLSQAILAPLDAIFKAQIHAARSFLNLLLQVGYPHKPVDKTGRTKDLRDLKNSKDDAPYSQEFFYEIDNEVHKVSIPALALVPLAPLAVETATFKLEMNVEWVDYHAQMQESEKESIKQDEEFGIHKRPWYLVSEPLSIRGTFAPSGPRDLHNAQSSSIQIEVKVVRTKMPVGLDKLLSSLTQAASDSGPTPQQRKENK